MVQSSRWGRGGAEGPWGRPLRTLEGSVGKNAGNLVRKLCRCRARPVADASTVETPATAAAEGVRCLRTTAALIHVGTTAPPRRGCGRKEPSQ